MLSYERQKDMKIKRIVCLLLALSCVFALFSCGPSADEIIEIVGNSSPTKVITQTSVNDGSETLSGRFETAITGSDSEMIYEYERYATVEEGLAENNPDLFIKTVSGKVIYKNGSYSLDGENWTTDVPDITAIQGRLNLTEKNLGKFSISEDEKTLTTTLTSAQAKAILGIDVAATEDGVSLTIITDGTYLRSISVSYATEKAENISIETSYSYNAVVSDGNDGEE